MATKAFRVQYKTVGLTYSQCPLPRERIIEVLSEKYPIGDYYVAKETHKDGNFHLHVWFDLTTKPNIKSSNAFDVDGYHPNIGNKKRNWIYNYLKKQDKEPYTNIPTGFIQLAIDGKLKEATDAFITQYPKDYAINKEKVDRNFRSLGKRKHEETVYPLKSEWDPEWDPKEHSLFLHGPSGTGKTEWAKSYVVHKLGLTYLRITHIDMLKTYNGEDVLIFDDVSFLHLPAETSIQLTETKNSRAIHCRHTVANIPAGVANIFLHNSNWIFGPDIYGAVKRRLQTRAPSIRFY